MEAFSAILFICFISDGLPACNHTVWPKVLTSEQQCLDTLAAGIKAAESRDAKVIGYRCIDWTNSTDEKASL
jgi:hypothetical protein